MARHLLMSNPPVRRPQYDPPPRSTATTTELDTDGNPVPINKPHAFTYDDGGNLLTDTVTDGDDSWVRTYTWSGTNKTSDSGWVKQ